MSPFTPNKEKRTQKELWIICNKLKMTADSFYRLKCLLSTSTLTRMKFFPIWEFVVFTWYQLGEPQLYIQFLFLVELFWPKSDKRRLILFDGLNCCFSFDILYLKFEKDGVWFNLKLSTFNYEFLSALANYSNLLTDRWHLILFLLDWPPYSGN